jgi:hypothetical protein
MVSTDDCRAISKFKQQKKAWSESKSATLKKSLAFLFFFNEINTLKRQLKPENTASSKKRKAGLLISGKIEDKEYLFISSKPFSTSEAKQEKSYHPKTK